MITRIKHQFSSVLAKDILEFIALTRACGYKYHGEENMLRRFDKFMLSHNYRKRSLTSDILLKWNARGFAESRRSQGSRICLIKQFAGYLQDIGVPVSFPPVFKIVSDSPDFIPYIFSREQIISLFDAADAEAKVSNRSWIASCFPVILRLLYSSGIRAGEVINLRWSDVDIKNGVIKIRQGKFRKDRLIPLSNQMWKTIEIYAEKQKNILPEMPVFQGICGKEIGGRTLYSQFRKVLFRAGIPHGGRGKGPRVHDLRHTFAVHNLAKWLSDKQDLNINLPILVDYLGHETMSGTQKYLHLTPAIFAEMTKRAEQSIGKRIRKIDNEKH